MKPTRIVKKPKAAGRSLKILCDDGQTYSLTALAKTVGLDASNLSGRIKTLGWDNPMVLTKVRRAKGEASQQSPYKIWQEGDLAHLSDTPRWMDEQ